MSQQQRGKNHHYYKHKTSLSSFSSTFSFFLFIRFSEFFVKFALYFYGLIIRLKLKKYGQKQKKVHQRQKNTKQRSFLCLKCHFIWTFLPSATFSYFSNSSRQSKWLIPKQATKNSTKKTKCKKYQKKKRSLDKKLRSLEEFSQPPPSKNSESSTQKRYKHLSNFFLS